MARASRLLTLAGAAALAALAGLACRRTPQGPPRPVGGPTLLTFSRVPEAWTHSRGRGVTVAVLDWQFDPEAPTSGPYVSPTSLVPGERMGDLEPWHGSWMVGIVHAVAPEASIMPIIARGLKHRGFADTLPQGIRYAADHGAAVVTSSMGQMVSSPELRDAVEYALARGCLFVDVHPELVAEPGAEPRPCTPGECLEAIVHTGIVGVPTHPTRPEDARDVYTWPYDLDAAYMDGWGFSNAPPVAAGVIALVRSANPSLPAAEVKRLLVETAVERDGFRVLDAAAAVQAALAARPPAA